MPARKLIRKLGLFAVVILLVVLAALVAAPSVFAQAESGLNGRPRIVQGIDEANRVVLAGNTHQMLPSPVRPRCLAPHGTASIFSSMPSVWTFFFFGPALRGTARASASAVMTKDLKFILPP